MVLITLLASAQAASHAGTKDSKDTNETYSLRTDPHLQAPLSVDAKNPTLQEWFSKLEVATKLKFSLAEEMRGQELQFGLIKMPNTKAWVVMQMILNTAKKQSTEAKLVKTS
jgi:hypothetical protein